MPENTVAPAPKTVEAFAFRKVRAGTLSAPVPVDQKPVVIASVVQQPKPKTVEKLSAHTKPQVEVTGLRTDGPTLEEYVEAGYDAEHYPPEGYAVRKKVFRFAKLSGTTAKTVFEDGSFYQWRPTRRQGGGYSPTTSCETSDVDLAAKLREAAKTDKSIREAPSL